MGAVSLNPCQTLETQILPDDVRFKAYEETRSRQTSSLMEEVATSKDSKGFRVQLEFDSQLEPAPKLVFFLISTFVVLVLKYF
jgi:hypothetical protein